MALSNRLQKLPPHFFTLLLNKIEKAMAEGRDVINLGRGNPDQPTPPHIIKALQEAVEDPATHGYSPFRGTLELRQAVAEFYQREYGVTVDPETEVAVLGGTKIGVVELPLAIMNEGELLLLPDPGYPDYLSGISLADIRFETMPLLKENGFFPDYDALPEDQKKDAKLMYLNYPSNPTGVTATPEFYEKTVSFAKEHNISVLQDFAYGGIGFEGKKPISFLQTEGAKDVGIEMLSLSKMYNMAGWRVGFAVGNSEMIEALNILQDHLFTSIFPAVQRAAIEALTGPQQCVEELIALYEKRLTVLLTECERIGWNVTAPTGSFFAWLSVPEGFTSETFADLLLDKADVAVSAGNGFGTYGEGYIRVGLLESEERLQEAVRRIEKLGLFK
ncbi:pyridoxal phosphate-dependent aminotransferase [Sporosarcina sp. GW1-11]|uniref:pyridoxal phosphate-dependent aminotransferase n=1 Tax=Sporosarcina sp. GW1-11 TaxID=2899126 RepID=UPI00294CA752|nr:pyridoxal phosphate-dependent aminotransferase [Sporosarcina sp. GW1-11]MDV6378640.1 pyridoxal phosphate-dependent aminotransferase [Sporosarcina sp. GW1-11]